MFPIEVHFDTPPPRLVSGLVARLRLAPTTRSAAAHLRADGGAGRRRWRSRQRVRRRRRQARSAATCASRSSPPTASRSRAVSPPAKPWSPMARCSSRTARAVEILRDTTKQAVNTPARGDRELSAVPGSRRCRSSNFRSAATSSRWSRSCAWSRSAGTRSPSVPREEDPYFKIPGYTIAAIYPGADPKDLERLVAKPIEDRLAALDDVLKMETSIRDGVSFTAIEFETFVDADKKYDEVTREVNALRPEFPPETQIIIRQVFTGPGEHRCRSRWCPTTRRTASSRTTRASSRTRSRPSTACAPRRAGPIPARELRVAVDLQAHVRAQPRARAGHRRRAERERQHSRGLRRPRAAQLQPQDLRQLHLARPGARHRHRLRSTAASCACATSPR